jgi:hypothetical protein
MKENEAKVAKGDCTDQGVNPCLWFDQVRLNGNTIECLFGSSSRVSRG